MDHVEEYQPRLVVLGPFERETIAPLLCKGLLGDVFGELQPLGLHANVLHEVGVGAEPIGQYPFHSPDTLAHYLPESLSLRHLMHYLESGFPVAEAQVHSSGGLFIYKAPLEAFHCKGGGGPNRYGI